MTEMLEQEYFVLQFVPTRIDDGGVTVVAAAAVSVPALRLSKSAIFQS
jgi:hypothetical protein